MSETTPLEKNFTVEYATRWIEERKKFKVSKEQYNFGICLKGSSELIGCVLLVPDWRDNKAELGYWMGTDFCGQGYTSEAAHQMSGWGFEELGLNKIFAQCMVTNLGSRRVLEKIGMEQEAVLKSNFRLHNKYHDTCYFGLTKADWMSLQSM